MEMLVESEQKVALLEWSRCRVKSVEVESVHGTQITIVNETLESRKIRCEKGEKKVIVFE